MKNYVISAVVSLFIGLVAFYLMRSSGGVKAENAGTVLMFSVVIAVFTVSMPLAFLAFRKLYANNKLFFWLMIVFASWFVALFFWFDAILLNALILGFVLSFPVIALFFALKGIYNSFMTPDPAPRVFESSLDPEYQSIQPLKYDYLPRNKKKDDEDDKKDDPLDNDMAYADYWPGNIYHKS